MDKMKASSSKRAPKKVKFPKKNEEVLVAKVDNSYEVTPVYEFDENGKVISIKSSRILTNEERRNIEKRRKEACTHIHPEVVSLTEAQLKLSKKKKENHLFKKRLTYLLLWIYILVSIFHTILRYFCKIFISFNKKPSVQNTPFLVFEIKEPSSHHHIANDKGFIRFNHLRLIQNLFLFKVKK